MRRLHVNSVKLPDCAPEQSVADDHIKAVLLHIPAEIPFCLKSDVPGALLTHYDLSR